MKIFGIDIKLAAKTSPAPPTKSDSETLVEGLAQIADTPDPWTDVRAAATPDFSSNNNYRLNDWSGDKFDGGFGITELFSLDYCQLRERSFQLFYENLYARGILRRMITNEINTGLFLEAIPNEGVLGVEFGSLAEWTEQVEGFFDLWAKTADMCDYKRNQTFYQLQQQIRLESLIQGDMLVVMRQDRVTKLPRVQVIEGRLIQNPLITEYTKLKEGHTVIHGVEHDAKGRDYAYWVRTPEGNVKPIRAYGSRTGRRKAKLIYSCEKMTRERRGEPILGIILQSLKELDRYRDSAQRKAVINSILAMFIKKDEDRMGTKPMSRGVNRKGVETATDQTGITGRSYNIANSTPGLIIEELAYGEEPIGFHSQGTDINFPAFEEAIVHAIAWAYEYPPSIVKLVFGSNYAASQGEINELKRYLNRFHANFGNDLCAFTYTELFTALVLLGKIEAKGYLEALNDPNEFWTVSAWTDSDWAGAIKPSNDLVKTAKGYRELIDAGLITRARSAREITGMKYSRIARELAKENEQYVDARKPLTDEQKDLMAAAPDREGGGTPTKSGDSV